MKKFKNLLFMMIIGIFMTGCFSSGNDTKVVEVVDGHAYGRVGELNKTAFFEYTVDAVNYVESYEGHTPAEGMQLIDAVVTVKNTFGRKQPMWNVDFQIQWHNIQADVDSQENFGYGITLEESKTLMPEEYEQKPGEISTYHILYEVPAEANEFSISFLEIFEDQTEGNLFWTFFEKE